MSRTIIRKDKLVQTCEACPSQWHGETADGRWVYIRYRWGGLNITVGKDQDDAVGGESVLTWDGGDGMDGLMTTEQLIEVVNKSQRVKIE